MGTIEGMLKKVAKALGITKEEYETKRREGFKWCWCCKDWLPYDNFSLDRSKGDMLQSRCRECDKKLNAGRDRSGWRQRRRKVVSQTGDGGPG